MPVIWGRFVPVFATTFGCGTFRNGEPGVSRLVQARLRLNVVISTSNTYCCRNSWESASPLFCVMSRNDGPPVLVTDFEALNRAPTVGAGSRLVAPDAAFVETLPSTPMPPPLDVLVELPSGVTVTSWPRTSRPSAWPTWVGAAPGWRAGP